MASPPQAAGNGTRATNLMPGCSEGAHSLQQNKTQPTPPLYRASVAPLPCAQEEKGLYLKRNRVTYKSAPWSPTLACGSRLFLAFLFFRQAAFAALCPVSTDTHNGGHILHSQFVLLHMNSIATQLPHKNLPMHPRGSAHAKVAACPHPTGRDTCQQGKRPLL